MAVSSATPVQAGHREQDASAAAIRGADPSRFGTLGAPGPARGACAVVRRLRDQRGPELHHRRGTDLAWWGDDGGIEPRTVFGAAPQDSGPNQRTVDFSLRCLPSFLSPHSPP